MAKQEDEPIWGTAPIDEIETTDLPKIPESDLWISPKNSGPSWTTDPIDNASRSTLLKLAVGVLLGLLLSYVALGWSHIKSIDDVLKLLGPPLQLVTTLLGAVLGYFFYRKTSNP